jgi:hypothetical protein
MVIRTSSLLKEICFIESGISHPHAGEKRHAPERPKNFGGAGLWRETAGRTSGNGSQHDRPESLVTPQEWRRETPAVQRQRDDPVVGHRFQSSDYKHLYLESSAFGRGRYPASIT